MTEQAVHFSTRAGRIALELRVIRTGNDIQCLLGGGSFHIGAVALAWPNSGGEPDAQGRLICLPGNREGEIALRTAQTLAIGLNCTVCVNAGMHFDDITREEIAVGERLTDELSGQCLEFLTASRPRA